MGGAPENLPAEYLLADPIEAVPLPVPVLCLHSRRDDEVPFRYSDTYVTAAVNAGGDARLRETNGDHYTLIDPEAEDWAVALEALDTWF
jgi:fermentation-respiration switch protein FrsA (DUF1100 family)